MISYSLEGLEMDGPTVMTIAQAEGLEAHSRAVGLRLAMAYGLDDDGEE